MLNKMKCPQCSHDGTVADFLAINQKPAESPNHLDMTDRELATILHALRVIQAIGITRDLCTEDNGCDHFDEVDRLNDIEIDQLCERINLGPEEPAPDPVWSFVLSIGRLRTTDEFRDRNGTRPNDSVTTLDTLIKLARKLSEQP